MDNSFSYSVVSKELTSALSKLDKKNDGIYFTPPSRIHNNIELLEPYITKNYIKCVLEPSCGSCEYITALGTAFPHLNITGIEYNKTIYNSITHLNDDAVTIYNEDYLNYTPDKKFDLIIGNPPFYVMKKQDVQKEYHKYFDGRPNIFILFIIKSLQLLNDEGILSFVLPKNFLNCLYYDKTRKHIGKYYKILHIIDCASDKYIDTQQDTIILIVQKTKIYNNLPFILEKHNYTIFVTKENKQTLIKLYTNSSSLWDLGFKVSVGTVVWNQCKDILTHDTTKTRLIYSSDIDNNKLIMKKYNNDEKKNYINKEGITRPVLVINRGYGVGEYKFNYCLINESNDYKEYLIENHLICVECQSELEDNKLIELYKKIMLSFDDERTLEFINIYFGNNAINTTELNYMLPIYQDI